MRSLPRPTRRHGIAAVVAVGAAAALAAAALPAQASTVHQRHVVPGSTPAWLSRASAVGAPAAASKVSFGVLLAMRNTADAQATIQRLSDPASADYGKWLTHTQFDQRYAPTAASVAAVQSWLRSQGFSVDQTLPSGMLVEASGTASQVAKAFDTQLKTYKYAGKTVRANASPLSLPDSTPSAVVGAVKAITGVDQGSTIKKPADSAPPPSTGSRYGVQPCSDYFGQKQATDKPKAYGKTAPYAVCGYTPAQYQSAYGESDLIKSGTTGKGYTVAITDAYDSPTLLSDANRYASLHGQPQFAKGQFLQVNPGPDGYSDEALCGDWYGEQTLDVEAVHAMAPGANITYVGGTNCAEGLDNAWASAIDNHYGDIVTNSWGDDVDTVADLGQDYIDYYQQYSTEAALTGITVNFSSGDDGDLTAGGTDLSAKTASFPADLPYVTGVGGSSIEIGKNGQRIGEYGWQTDYAQLTSKNTWAPAPPGTYSSGGGGGTSQLFAQPYYQKGVVPAAISQYYGSTPMRSVPDIAMAGDPNTGFVVGQTQQFPDGLYYDQYRIGGTSLSSPLLAGVFAVASQKAGHALGFVNPLLYKLLGTGATFDTAAPKTPQTQVRTNFVNTVDDQAGRSYELQTIDVQSSTLKDTYGYDDETGVGTPAGPQFFTQLAALAEK